MACFHTLTADESAAVADAFALGQVLTVTPIAAGTISSNFAFDTIDRGRERRTFIRLNEGKAAADVAWEAALLDVLVAGGVPTTPALRTTDGHPYFAHRGWPIGGFAWCPGRHLAPGEVTADHARAIGRATAELHRAAAALPPARQRAGIYQFADLTRRFVGFADATDPALASAIAVLADELAWLTARTPQRAAASHGLIHGDLFRDNVLWEGADLRAILDFEQAATGSRPYDLAVVLNDWCWRPRPEGGGEPEPALAAAVLAGYQAVQPLTAADRVALPIEVRAAAARFTITRITDVYLRQVDMPDKDFRAFLARLLAWRGPALGALLSSV